MGLSKEKRIVLFIAIDLAFFLLEIVVGYFAHSLALVADAFHMLNDVLSLCVGLWAVRVATNRSSNDEYTYGWARAELLGGLINGVFLVALCLTIFLDAIQRFAEPQEVSQPKLVLIVGAVGLLFNILGLFVFHQHSHGHGHEHEEQEDGPLHGIISHDVGTTATEDGHGHVQKMKISTNTPERIHHTKSASVTWDTGSTLRSSEDRGTGHFQRRSSASSRQSGRRQASQSYPDQMPVYPPSIRDGIMSHATRWSGSDDGFGDEEETTRKSEDNSWSRRYKHATPQDLQESEETEAVTEASEVDSLLQKGNNSRELNGRSSKQDDKISKPHISQLDGNKVSHKHHNHAQPKDEKDKGHGHSHADMNINGIFLHVLGDALGNIGVMVSALIIWLTTSPARFYADPAISLVITLIILKSALPLCRDTAKPLLQAVPGHIKIDEIREDIETLPGVRSCHHVHVWALTPSKLVATLDVELDFDFEGPKNTPRYMQLAREIKSCLHAYGIHSSTIQPEFCTDTRHRHGFAGGLEGTVEADSDSPTTSSTTSTVIAGAGASSSALLSPGDQNGAKGGLSAHTGPNTDNGCGNGACLLDCNAGCATGKQCCGPAQGNESGSGKTSGISTPRDEEEGGAGLNSARSGNAGANERSYGSINNRGGSGPIKKPPHR
ncbi:MAG: hypothetical protein M1831_007576 [Alyxoria varia]|nr:MAG: hypothetical protein M1831_007576 [Alyxoria varia]